MSEEINGSFRQPNPENIGFEPVLLRDLLIETTLSPDMAIRDGVKRIDLGNLGAEAETIRANTLADPEKKERGRIVYVTYDRRLFVQTKDLVGKRIDTGDDGTIVEGIFPDLEILTHKNFYAVQRQYRQNRFLATVIHCHKDIEIPASPQDMRYLLLNQFELSACPLVFVVTVQRKMLIFRGRGTPQFPQDIADKKVEGWYREMIERQKRFIKPEMSESEQIGICARANHALIRQLAMKYDFRLYSCAVSENIASLESA